MEKSKKVRTVSRVLQNELIENQFTKNELITYRFKNGCKTSFKDTVDRNGNPLHGELAIVALLKACAKKKDLHRGTMVHADIIETGLLKKNIYIGNSLVNFYAKCGEITKAECAFFELPVKSLISWTSLIQGYVQNRQDEKALLCFERMRFDGMKPDAMTYVCVLKACGNIAALDKGEELHGLTVKEGLLGKTNVLDTAVVDMYAKCGALSKAQKVFDDLVVRDVISWTALITGYVHHEHGMEAIDCFEQMQYEGVLPNVVTFSCILKACGNIGAVDKGEEIHDRVVKDGLLSKSSVLGLALVDMYAKCGVLTKAAAVFNKLPSRSLASWTALITGYAQHGLNGEALNCFDQMQREGIYPDSVSFMCVLKACGNLKASEKTGQIHAMIVKQGLLAKNTSLCTALVHTYVKLGFLTKAHQLLDELPVKVLASWNAIIAGYGEHRHEREALYCLEQMQQEAICPDAVTFACILKVCANTGAADKGKRVHVAILGENLLAESWVLGTALLDMYAKCGELANAQEVFDELSFRDVVSWTVLISAYAQYGYGDEPLNCLERMQNEGISPNIMTFPCILKACGNIGAFEKGKEIHVEIARKGLLEKDSVLGTALVDMYSRCGVIAMARQVFDGLPIHNIVSSWNALIAGYTEIGEYNTVFALFRKMILDGIEPDIITFTIILKSCSSSTLLDDGEMYFGDIGANSVPTVEHHTCMVGLYASSGHFEKAMAIIKKLPLLDYLPMWYTLLSACKKWGNVEIGRLAFENATRLDNQSAVPYIYMSNIYEAAGMQEEADNIAAMRI